MIIHSVYTRDRAPVDFVVFGFVCDYIVDGNLDALRNELNLNPGLLNMNFKLHEHGNIYTLFGFAVWHDKFEVMEMLTDQFNVNPNQENCEGATPLHLLIRKDRCPFDVNSSVYQCAQLLLSRGANPDHISSTGAMKSPREYLAPESKSLFSALLGMPEIEVGKNCHAVFSQKAAPKSTLFFGFKNTIQSLSAVSAVAAVSYACLKMKFK